MKCFICNKLYGKENGAFFRVPAEEPRRHRWNMAWSIEFPKSARVCEEHFTRDDFISPPGIPNVPARLKVCAVPSLKYKDIAECCPVEETILPERNLFDVNLVLPASRMHCCAQTDDELSESYKVTICKLELKVKELQSELAACRAELLVANKLNRSINSLFTSGQKKKLQNPEKSIHWDWRDISNAICLHAAGPKAYTHLYNKGWPLPHVSTLQRWAQKVDIREGILGFAIDCMKNNSDLSEDEKICVLSFDEMKVAAVYEHDPSTDFVREPCNYVQVAMARGLKASWKQPVFYGFDCKMTKTILTQLIQALRDVGFPVVAVVSDMCPTNQALWKELNVSIAKPWFNSPADETEKVFVFADVPHLVKLIRNHFLDTGLIWNGALLTSQTLKQVMQHTSSSDMSIVYKLTEEHISVRGPGRQKVKLAVQLFSNTTASAIRRCFCVGKDLYKPLETAEFVQLINDWFDVLNSKMVNFNMPGKKPYGKEISYQDVILNRMDAFMSNPIIPGRSNLAPFQKGVLLTNASLRLLREYVSQKYNVHYILTNRLDQDVLEHLFGAIRSKGGLADHPSPNSFKYRMRKYLLARNTQLLNSVGNVAPDETEWLNSTINKAQSVSALETSVPTATQSSCENFDFQSSQEDPQCSASTELEEFSEEFPPEIDDENPCDETNILRDDALEYVAGYVIKKLHLSDCEDVGGATWTYVNEVSKGGLRKPSETFLQLIKQLETVFNNVNGDKIVNNKKFQTLMLNHSTKVELAEPIKKFFFKCRMHFRIKHLNKRLTIQKAKQRIMGSKKYLKILI